MRWRRLILGLGVIGVIITATVARPRTVACETIEHTYCPESLSFLSDDLADESFLLSFRRYRGLEESAQRAEPALASLRFRRTPTWSILAVAEMSPVVFTLQAEGKNYAVRANGLVLPVEQEAQPLLIFSQPNEWLEPDRSRVRSLRSDDLLRLGTLYSQFQHFSPRVSKLTFVSPQEIRLTLEGKGPIIVRADDSQWLELQLSALQAFFRSSTMADGYQEVDARFSDLVVR